MVSHGDRTTPRVAWPKRHGDTAVADALAAAIRRQQGRERLVARKCKRDEEEAARRQEEAVISRLWVELRELRDTDLV